MSQPIVFVAVRPSPVPRSVANRQHLVAKLCTDNELYDFEKHPCVRVLRARARAFRPSTFESCSSRLRDVLQLIVGARRRTYPIVVRSGAAGRFERVFDARSLAPSQRVPPMYVSAVEGSVRISRRCGLPTSDDRVVDSRTISPRRRGAAWMNKIRIWRMGMSGKNWVRSVKRW